MMILLQRYIKRLAGRYIKRLAGRDPGILGVENILEDENVLATEPRRQKANKRERKRDR